jgi:hypothetical protein
MLAAGRSPWPLGGLLGGALAGRILIGAKSGIDARRSAVLFWSGFGLGVLLFFAFRDQAYDTMTGRWAETFTTFLPSSLRRSGQWLRVRPLAVAGLVVAACLLEIALRRPRAWLDARLAVPGRRLLRPAAWAAVVLVPLSFTGSLLVAYPVLPLSQPLAASQRVATVLGSMATMFRLKDPDFLLASSFWVGFGWLDTMPGPVFQALLVMLVALALVALLRSTAQRQEARRFAWLLVLGAGATAALVLYTLATQTVPIALGGRYLIGWYLPVLSVIGSVLCLRTRAPVWGVASTEMRTGSLRAAALLALVGPIQVYCLCFILRRYF